MLNARYMVRFVSPVSKGETNCLLSAPGRDIRSVTRSAGTWWHLDSKNSGRRTQRSTARARRSSSNHPWAELARMQTLCQSTGHHVSRLRPRSFCDSSTSRSRCDCDEHA